MKFFMGYSVYFGWRQIHWLNCFCSHPLRATPLRVCSRPEQAAQDVLPYILNDFRRAVPAMRRGGFGNSCRNCAALVPAYLFSRMKMLNGVGEGVETGMSWSEVIGTIRAIMRTVALLKVRPRVIGPNRMSV